MEGEHKKAFLMYCDYRQHLALLSDEECGKLFIAILDYAESKKAPKLTGAAAMAFSFIKAQMDRDSVKYEERCAVNRENGAKGGRPRKQQEAEASDENQTKPKITERFSEKPKKPDTDNDTDKDNDNDKETDTGNGTRTASDAKAIKAERAAKADTRFSVFWSAYPKKVGKASSEKAWRKLSPNDNLFQKIMSALEVQKHSTQWTKDGGRYIPNPLTWLNGERWNDEPQSISPAPQATGKVNTMGVLARMIVDEEGGTADDGIRYGTGIPSGFKDE